MITKKKLPQVFLRYLLSYVLVLFIPIIATVLLVFGNFINIIKKEVLTENLNTLNVVRNIIDNELQQLNETASQIYSSIGSNPFFFMDDPFMSLNVQKELMKYRATNPFYDDVFLYFQGDNFLHSCDSSIELNRFINKIYRFEYWSDQDFFSTLNESKTCFFRPAETVIKDSGLGKTTIRYITYICPLPIGASNPRAHIMFIIPEGNIKIHALNSFGELTTETIIFDGLNNIITTTDQKYMRKIPHDTLMSLVTSDTDTESQTIKAGSLDLLVSKVVSAKYDWKFISIIPMGQIMGKADSIKTKLAYGLVVTIMVGVLAILYFMRINYNPIKKLKIMSDKYFTTDSSSNEIDSIRLHIEKLLKSNNNLNGELVSNKNTIKEMLVLMMLKNQIKTEKELNLFGKEGSFSLSRPYYVSMVLDITNVNSDRKRDLLTGMIKENLLHSYDVLYSVDILKGFMIIILGTDSPEIFEIQQNIDGYLRLVQYELRVDITCGLGNLYEDINFIGRSFFEAATSLRIAADDDSNALITTYESFVRKIECFDYPENLLKKFRLCLKHKNPEIIKCVVNNLNEFIKNSSAPIHIISHLYYDVFTIFMDLVLSESWTVANDIEHINYIQLVHIEKKHQIISKLNHLYYSICKYLDQQRNAQINPAAKLISYIKNNYTDPRFTLQAMAEQFDMLPPNLSQYFKQHTGINISEYITNLKFIKAKQLLLTSDKTLKEIVGEIGYYDVSSFIRKFKNHLGMTPNDYRNQYKGQMDISFFY